MREEDSASDTDAKAVTKLEGTENLEDYPLSKETIANLRAKGIEKLFPIQIACFHPIFQGKDVIGRDRTGSGKTLAFALPILEKLRQKGKFINKQGQRPFKIVIVPTRELAMQVTSEYTRFKNHDNEFRIATLYGSSDIGMQLDALRRGAEIVVGTPGRLIDLMERRALQLDKLKVFVLDETDQMLNMGFQQDIDRILQFLRDDFQREKKDVKDVQYLLFSATVPRWVERVCQNFMSSDMVRVDMVKGRSVKTSTTVEHLAIFFKSREDKVRAIGDVVQVYGGQHCRTIIFTDKKEEGNEVLLHGNLKVECQVLNGDIPQKQREVTFKAFKDGNLKCLVATNLASRGLDFPQVDLIVQLSPPLEIDTYIHRSGRTGRAGKSGKCITFYLQRQQDAIERIEAKAGIKLRTIGAPQADDVVRANARDVTSALSQVSKEVLGHFEESVESILLEYDSKEALARALAIISGYTQGIKNRSMLSGGEGYVTFVVESDQEANSQSYFWGILRRNWPAHIADSIRGLRMLNTRHGCVFDIEEKFQAEIEALAPSLEGRGVRVYQPKELPAVEERSGFQGGGRENHHSRELRRPGFSGSGGHGGGYGGGHGNSGGGSASKKDYRKLFVANIPPSCSEGDLGSLVKSRGYQPDDVYFLRNPDNTLKGFGYLRFADEKEAGSALKDLQGIQLNGRSLRLDFADLKQN